MTSPVACWHVPDIEAKLVDVTAAGATVKEPTRDVGGGRLVATVTDPDGNVLGLLSPGRRRCRSCLAAVVVSGPGWRSLVLHERVRIRRAAGLNVVIVRQLPLGRGGGS
jgi:hypothetical protein